MKIWTSFTFFNIFNIIGEVIWCLLNLAWTAFQNVTSFQYRRVVKSVTYEFLLYVFYFNNPYFLLNFREKKKKKLMFSTRYRCFWSMCFQTSMFLLISVLPQPCICDDCAVRMTTSRTPLPFKPRYHCYCFVLPQRTVPQRSKLLIW